MVVQLNFNTPEDEGLNLTGTVTFPREAPQSEISIRGLGKWRHLAQNQIGLSKSFINNFKLEDEEGEPTEKGKKILSEAKLQFFGLKASSDILLSHPIRKGRTGALKVQDQLNKFFRAIGASNVSISLEDE